VAFTSFVSLVVQSSAVERTWHLFAALQDLECVRRGIYKLPWDMTTTGHRQTNPLNVLDKFTRYPPLPSLRIVSVGIYSGSVVVRNETV
jgi:hypothetical protein